MPCGGIKDQIGLSSGRFTLPVGLIDGIISDLERLNRDTEREFLLIGGKVAELIKTVDAISSELNALAKIFSGEQGQRAADSLSRTLSLFTEIKGRAEQHSQFLRSMRAEAGKLKRTLARFSETAFTFHSLALLTRIEMARLGQAGTDFGNLAQDVSLLARNVQTKVENALDTAGELTPAVEGALLRLSGLDEGLAEDLPPMIAQILQSLASFREMQQTTQFSSARLGREYSDISEAFKQLIVNLQFQDISRQQIEHVTSALRGIAGNEGNIENAETAAIMARQARQLSAAAEEFLESTVMVGQSLDQIAGSVVKMSEESRSLAGQSENDSFFPKLELACGTIVAGLEQCGNAEDATHAASQGLTEKIDQMRGSIQQIQNTEVQMRRTAMNAMISAVELGESGTVLGALADTIRQRAHDLRKGSEELMEALDAIKVAAIGFSTDFGVTAEQESVASCLQEMRNAIDELGSSDAGTQVQITHLTLEGDRLCHKLAEARASLAIGTHFHRQVTQSRVKLEGILGRTTTGVSGHSVATVVESGDAETNVEFF